MDRASVLGSIGAPKRTRIGAIVEKPSRLFSCAALELNEVTGMFSVPSVVPLKNRSIGYGSTPTVGWNSGLKPGAAG